MNELNKAIAIDSGSELEKLILAKAKKNFYNRSESSIFDLYPFYAILVSTGTNKNSDHFDPVELWNARHSPVDKPVNIGHKQTRIIGHIIDNIVVGEDLKPIPEDTAEGDLPYKLHVITACVLYKVWEDPAVQAEVNDLIDKISKGSIFVSMECLFRDFAYLLTNASTNEQRILPRNGNTAGLTKYLRQYKGPGKIHNYSLARVLKNITFSAVGVVENPANPDSIISSNLDLFSDKERTNASESVYINIDCSKNTEKIMADIIIKETPEYKTLEASYAQLQSNYEVLKNDNTFIHTSVAEQKNKLEETERLLASVRDELAVAKSEKDKKDAKDLEDANATITRLEAEIESLKNSKAELATANDAMQATLDAYKKASRHSDRAEAMMGVDSSLTREAALQAVAKHDELSDASFAAMIEMIKSYASKAPKEVTAESVLATAQAERDAQYGAAAESKFDQTTAAIKHWYSNTKGTKKES